MPLSNIVYPAFKSILVNRLQKILHDYKNLGLSVTTSMFSNRSRPCLQERGSADEIPLNRVQRDDQLWYVSAIALKLATVTQDSATAIATQLVDDLIQDTALTKVNPSPLSLDSVWGQATMQLTPPGWMHFKFSDKGLALWLQLLSEWLLTSGNLTSSDRVEMQNRVGQPTPQGSSPRNCISSFEVLYTHARCCDLLRLGEQAGILRLYADPAQVASWQIVDPSPIPWWADDLWRCAQLPERRLIMQMVDVLDELSMGPAPSIDRIWGLAQRLSQAFQRFYAQCSIFALAQTDRPLAQARLGLVLLTQALLRWLLQDWLHLKPPIEL
jgi:hypothetical protein